MALIAFFFDFWVKVYLPLQIGVVDVGSWPKGDIQRLNTVNLPYYANHCLFMEGPQCKIASPTETP